jgi:putative FmdB family regulatory protein
MPVYPFRCGTCGCQFDVLRPIADRDSDQPCQRCGVAAIRMMTTVALGNQARIGIGRMAHPQTWEDVDGGHPDAIKYWTKRVEKEIGEEQRNPELASLRAANAAKLAAGTSPAHPASTSADAHPS